MNRSKLDAVSWSEFTRGVTLFQILRVCIALMLARIALVSLGFERTATVVRAMSGHRPVGKAADANQVNTALCAVSLAAAFIPMRLLCLERSLVLYYELRRTGCSGVLRLGVRVFPFAAHAWVEVNGAPANELSERLKDFEPIFELGA